MNRTSPSEVKAWCIERGFHPNKVLGQNFLIDRNILEAIVDAAGLTAGARVLEVGPGLGVMTEELLRRGARVTAVEKDKRLAEWLAESLRPGFPDRLELRNADMLECPLSSLSPEPFDAFLSNLPYSVGTRILMDVAADPLAPATLVTMVQTEVAERFAAEAGAPDRGVAGVWLQLDFDVSIVRHVKASCFWPRPEVQSTIAAMRRHTRGTLSPAQKERFRALTKHCFLYRRKQLATILRKGPWPNAPQALEAAGIDPMRRPETLTVAEWEKLTLAL